MIMIELYIKQYIKQLMMKYNFVNYDRAIYKTIDDEIQLCLIMIYI